MIIGHRGVKGSVMENTLESILKAIELGVDGIEFDVQTCLTGEIVLFHDDTLNRLAFKDQFYFTKTQNKPINKLQWYHLYNTQLIDTMGRKYKIPKLEDVLMHPTVYKSKVLINIEIKDTKSHERICNMLEDLVNEGLYQPDRFLVSSYHLEPLLYFNEFKQDMISENQKYRNFKIGWIFSQEDLPTKGILFSVKSHSRVLTHVILESSLINLSLIDKIKKLGLSIFVYTINSRSEYTNMDQVVDGIISDTPFDLYC